jgi:molybdenum cofactor synthesis domain-containing protein
MTIRVSILTVSDRADSGERPDISGPALKSIIEQQGWQIIDASIVPDESGQIAHKLAGWADSGKCDLILTTGGTGFTTRDVTPEATISIIERQTPGITQAILVESLNITPHAMLSRATSGIRARTLIVNLPGNPKAAVENLNIILPVLPHAIDLLQGNPAAESGHKKVSR